MRGRRLYGRHAHLPPQFPGRRGPLPRQGNPESECRAAARLCKCNPRLLGYSTMSCPRVGPDHPPCRGLSWALRAEGSLLGLHSLGAGLPFPPLPRTRRNNEKCFWALCGQSYPPHLSPSPPRREPLIQEYLKMMSVEKEMGKVMRKVYSGEKSPCGT